MMKTLKMIIDVLMLLFLVLSFLRWDGDPTFHSVMGIVFTLLAFVHICLNRKWLWQGR